MKAYERLLKYAVIKTPSDESSDSTPSSACQFDLANLLKKEMEELVCLYKSQRKIVLMDLFMGKVRQDKLRLLNLEVFLS